MKLSTIPCAVLLGAAPLSAFAYPPSPGFTVYGTVRDEFGWAVNGPLARIVFKNASTGAVISTAPVRTGGVLSENYRLTLPMDHQRSGTVYRPDAVNPSTSFTIEVVINNVTYFPLPVVAPPSTRPTAAEFLELNLLLGDDSDDDGLPDLWEQWQLEAAGFDPARLDLIARNGDPDGDGMTNLDEFISGTFAFLAFDNLSLKYVELTGDRWSRLEFLAVIDKTYALERSADLRSWEPAPFGLWQDRTLLQSDWQAPDTVRQTIQTPPGGIGTRWYYRLRVQ